MDTPRPLCFVLMPYGKKKDPTGRPDIDFDRVYEAAIRPAVEDAELVPVRSDQERMGGIVHKHMFERLLLCEYAVADLTTANANVFYELGVRHAGRPRSTQAIFARHQPIPFDVALVGALAYELGETNAFGEAEAAELRTTLGNRLRELRDLSHDATAADSPVFQLLGEWKPGEVSHLKADVFRDRVEMNEALRRELTRARGLRPKEEAVAALDAIRERLGRLDAHEAGAVVDLFLSYRDLEAYERMLALHEAMPRELRQQVLVREQRALALNREAARRKDPHLREQALEILEALEGEQGPSAERGGLIGRIYKDRWQEDLAASPRRARAHLEKAIAAYTRGFEADSRDHYPGINVLTLLEIHGSEASLKERDRLAPVVRYAAEQRMRGRDLLYWDHATLLELAVLAQDHDGAERYLGDTLAAATGPMMPRTTARNLGFIATAREERGEDVAWIRELMAELEREAGPEPA